MKKLRSRKVGKAVLALTEGVFSYLVDVGLWTTIYFAEMSIPQSRSGQTFRAKIAADGFLRDVNYDVIKTAIQNARKRGWIRTHRHAMPEITQAGRRRLAEILPRYDTRRVWDGRMHLVTYDIPEVQKGDREQLREYLRRIGCGLLQDSVWITPYNPVDTLRAFIDEHDLSGNIIVSDMGKDGSIGEEGLLAMIFRVYNLENLNTRYIEWIESVEDTHVVDQQLLIAYLSILRDDPQLPFSLLPKWWRGDKAYRLAEPFLSKVVI